MSQEYGFGWVRLGNRFRAVTNWQSCHGCRGSAVPFWLSCHRDLVAAIPSHLHGFLFTALLQWLSCHYSWLCCHGCPSIVLSWLFFLCDFPSWLSRYGSLLTAVLSWLSWRKSVVQSWLSCHCFLPYLFRQGCSILAVLIGLHICPAQSVQSCSVATS